MYYYINTDKKPVGPVPPEQLSRHGVTLDTYVWKKGMDGWVKARNVAELRNLFEKQHYVTNLIDDTDGLENYMDARSDHSKLKWVIGIGVGMIFMLALVVAITLLMRNGAKTDAEYDIVPVDTVAVDDNAAPAIPRYTTTEIRKDKKKK